MEQSIELQEYITAWLAYLLSCAVLITIGCLWTRVISDAYLRMVVRLVASTAMLVPVLHENNAQVRVPAVIVAVLGGLAGNADAALAAAKTLGLACLCSLLLALIIVKLLRVFGLGYQETAVQQPEEPSVETIKTITKKKTGTAVS